MSFVKLALFSALAGLASAAVHDIQVGGAGGKLEFSPEAISAAAGDQVVFHFNPKNHTVTQSAFADPCGRKEGGFDSDFMPVAANQTDNLPTYTVTVNNTDPIWVYCRQAANTPASHCGQGMVFAVNCGLDGAPNSFTNFKKSALAIGASLAAGSTTAAYGDYTIAAAPSASVVTQTISLETAVWTTTYASYPGSPQATPASLEGKVHTVIVGGPNATLVFDPPHVDAQPRDIIQFVFHQKNHTVTQSSFADPCRALNVNGTTGFDSGFMAVADDATSFPTWNITVNGTDPIWAYCRQKTPKSHCGAGMVFAVNSVEDSARNFTAFQNVAKALNGTVVADTATPSSTTTPNGAVSVKLTGLSVALAAAVAGLLL